MQFHLYNKLTLSARKQSEIGK